MLRCVLDGISNSVKMIVEIKKEWSDFAQSDMYYGYADGKIYPYSASTTADACEAKIRVIIGKLNQPPEVVKTFEI